MHAAQQSHSGTLAACYPMVTEDGRSPYPQPVRVNASTRQMHEARQLLAGWVRWDALRRLALSRLAVSNGDPHLLVPVVAGLFCCQSMLSPAERQANLFSALVRLLQQRHSHRKR